jgi:hypothetical protein
MFMIVYMNLFANQNIPKSHCSTLAVTFALGFRFGPCRKDSLEPIFLQSQRWHMFLQGFCSTILLYVFDLGKYVLPSGEN